MCARSKSTMLLSLGKKKKKTEEDIGGLCFLCPVSCALFIYTPCSTPVRRKNLEEHNLFLFCALLRSECVTCVCVCCLALVRLVFDAKQRLVVKWQKIRITDAKNRDLHFWAKVWSAIYWKARFVQKIVEILTFFTTKHFVALLERSVCLVISLCK